MRKCTKIFLSIKQPHFFPSVFSPFLGENFLVGLERKHLSSTIYFPSSPPNQTHFKNVFLLIFSSNFSINAISPPNKHTLRVRFFLNLLIYILGFFFFFLVIYVLDFNLEEVEKKLIWVYPLILIN